jgi:hypothetical protein
MAYEFKIGTTSLNKTLLSALATPVPDPKTDYKPFVELVNLGNGKVRGMGAPTVTWSWGYLTREQRDMLRTYCTGASASVFIRTRTNDNADTYDDYSAVMIWDENEAQDATRRIGLSVTFRNLVAE